MPTGLTLTEGSFYWNPKGSLHRPTRIEINAIGGAAVKLASALVDGTWRLAVPVDRDTAIAVLPTSLGTVDDVVRGGEAVLDAVREAPPDAPVVALAEVHLGPPLQHFNRDILCTGWNYWDHFHESKGKRDAGLSTRWDYEAEVALYSGRDGRSILEKRAWEHVFGLCVANDVSQRDLSEHTVDSG